MTASQLHTVRFAFKGSLQFGHCHRKALIPWHHCEIEIAGCPQLGHLMGKCPRIESNAAARPIDLAIRTRLKIQRRMEMIEQRHG
jgi:hypothetical protein